MARKTLLNEQEIRKFLKLANITTVGDQKIEEMGGAPMGGGSYARDDDEEPAADDGLGDEVEVDVDAELPVEDEPMADEPEDVGAELDVGGLDVSDKEELMADVVRAVADALGIADRVDVEAGEDEGEAMADLDAEPALDLEPEAALAPEEGGEDSLEEPADLGVGDDEEDEDPVMEEDEDTYQLSEEDVVAEVARRVAQRLQDANRKEAMVDTLAERILNRLTKK